MPRIYFYSEAKTQRWAFARESVFRIEGGANNFRVKTALFEKKAFAPGNLKFILHILPKRTPPLLVFRKTSCLMALFDLMPSVC